MRKLTTALLLVFGFVAAIITAPSLYAQGDQERSGAMMGRGMMADGNASDDGGMMGMMKMMKQMSQMMDHCNGMMNDSRPNDQWRKNTPSEKNG